MQIEALKVFCDVARFRSFSQAAAANDVSQPAASQVVSQLERRLGVKLVDRSTRPPHLTPAGQTYYDGVRDLMDRYLEVENEIRHSQPEISTTVQVAAIYSVGLRDMNQYVERFMAEHPGERAQIEYLHPDRVYEKVLDGSADLGLLSFPKRSRALVAIPWREEEMVVACSPTHPLARQRTVRISRLAKEALVHFDRGLTVRRQIDRLFRAHGVAPEVQLEFDNIANIKHAVEISGVALLPLPTIEREVAAHNLAAVRLADAHLVRPLAIVHRRNHKLSAPVRRFLDLLRQPEAQYRETAPRKGPRHPMPRKGTASR